MKYINKKLSIDKVNKKIIPLKVNFGNLKILKDV